MRGYVGDFAAGSTVRVAFNTTTLAQVAATLAGTPAIAVYKNGTTTESTAGASLTVDFDSKTGLHHAVIDTSADGTFYAEGNDFSVVLSAGTVDGISVASRVVGSFSLKNRLTNANLLQVLGVSVASQSYPKLHVEGTTTGTPTATSVPLTSTELSATDDAYVGMFLVPQSGDLAAVPRKITDYVASSKTFTVEAFPAALAAGVLCAVIGKVE